MSTCPRSRMRSLGMPRTAAPPRVHSKQTISGLRHTRRQMMMAWTPACTVGGQMVSQYLSLSSTQEYDALIIPGRRYNRCHCLRCARPQDPANARWPRARPSYICSALPLHSLNVPVFLRSTVAGWANPIFLWVLPGRNKVSSLGTREDLDVILSRNCERTSFGL